MGRMQSFGTKDEVLSKVLQFPVRSQLPAGMTRERLGNCR